MRVFAATLVQNLGTGVLGTMLDLTGHLVEVGGISFEVDKELTKMAPGDLSISVEDGDGSIWTWIQTQIQISGGLLSPFLTLDVEGVRVFTGIIKPSEISRDARTRKIDISAQDWSVMLASKPLTAADGWFRPEPKAISGRAASQSLTGYGSVTSFFGIQVCVEPDCIYFDEPMNSIVPGDIIDGTNGFGSTYTNLKALSIVHGSGPNGRCVVKVGQWVWPPGVGVGSVAQYTGTWTRRASATTPQAYYRVMVAVAENPDPAIYKISLDIVDGLTPGDVLELQNADRSASFTILQVDPIWHIIYVKEEVSNLAEDDRLYFSNDCSKQMVLEDARSILSRACAPYAADFAGCTPTTLPAPLLSWLPLRPFANDDLHSVSDIEAGLSTVRVFCGTLAWDGTPETGWTKVSGTPAAKVSWNDQQLSAPNSLMPDDTATLAPLTWSRNQAADSDYRNRGQNGDAADPTWNPDAAQTAVNAIAYDYPNMRRILFTGTTASIQAWNGSVWGGSTADTFPAHVQSAVEFGNPYHSVLALCTDNTLRLKVMPAGTEYPPLSIPAAATNAVLKNTPWGVYLVGSKGYGKITFASNALALTWATLSQNDDMRILTNTFCGINGAAVVLALVNGLDKDGVTVLTETYLLHLAAIPVSVPTARASILWSESVLAGAAVSCGAVRDPSTVGYGQYDRVIGHVGGRLFQFSAQMGIHYALERFTPSGMMASELIEHVCQVLNLVAYPDPLGTMYFKTRASSGTPTSLTVNQVEIMETRAWEHFYSIVRVAGQNETLYDAYSDTDGGDLLEINSHPLLWSNGACATMAEVYALWLGVPRQIQKQKWFWTDPDSPAQWEGLAPMTRLMVNATGPWLLLAMDDNRKDGTATATLLEVT